MRKLNFVWVVEVKRDSGWEPWEATFSREDAREEQSFYKSEFDSPSRIVKYISNNQAE